MSGDIDSSLMVAEAYFVTICTHGRQLTLGQIKDGQMSLSASGKLVEEEWLQTAETFPNVELDAYIVMPNHFHAIFWLLDGAPTTVDREKSSHSPESTKKKEEYPAEEVIKSFKAAVTNRAQQQLDYPNTPFWQPGLHVHRVRQPKALPSLRDYIRNNPADWFQDDLNPAVGDPSCAINPPPLSG